VCFCPVSCRALSRDLHSFPTRRSSDLRRLALFVVRLRAALIQQRVDIRIAVLEGVHAAVRVERRVERAVRVVAGSVEADEALEVDRKSTRLNSQSRENLVCRLLLEKKK